MTQFLEIKDINGPELSIYARLSEGQLLHYYEPAQGLFIAESPMIIQRALDAGYRPLSMLVEHRLAESQEGNWRRGAEISRFIRQSGRCWNRSPAMR